MIDDIGPRYGTRIQRSHNPPKVTGLTGYAKYRNCLRLEFAFTCVFCLSTEREVGPGADYGGFEIEHFRPKGVARFKKRRNHYFNLLWSCRACNQAKGSKWPTKTAELNGDRLLDPDVEHYAEHLQIIGDQVVVLNDSRLGAYTVRRLRLNSRLHIDRRCERVSAAKTRAMLQSNAMVLRQRVYALPLGSTLRQELQAELDDVERCIPKSRTTPPWDAPSSCLG